MKPIEILQEAKQSPHAVVIDLSKWNVLFDLDAPLGITPADAAEIVDGVILRATVAYAGSGYVEKDRRFDEFYAECEQHPEDVRGAYPFLNKYAPWTKQYNKFLEAIDGKEFELLCPDAEHHSQYNDLRNRADAERFAGIVYYFTKQLIKDFPDKRILLYTNRSTYTSYLDPYYDMDEFDLWLAEWPYGNWETSAYLAAFRAWVTGLFAGEKQPTIPASRAQNDWELWQAGAYTGIGKELGLGADYLDVNISRRTLDDFRRWSGLYRRWTPEGEAPTPPPVTDAEKLNRLWAAHPELH
jgi:hypothetical protein